MQFVDRHLGPNDAQKQAMLEQIGISSMSQLIDEVIPSSIRLQDPLKIAKPMSEYDYLNYIQKVGNQNLLFKSYIGLGYYNCILPSVIRRNILENPAWYTQYTPYQAEIAQGRLEALLNFQTMVSDLTAMEMANASLLDEATAAAEAMTMTYAIRNKSKKKTPAHRILVDHQCLPQTIDVLYTRAKPLNIEVDVANPNEENKLGEDVFAILLQYPDVDGRVDSYHELIQQAKEVGAYIIFAADLMSLCLLTPPGELGADIVVGNTQRFGIPLGYGGPHAAYLATKEEFKRNIPGRIIGVSLDRREKQAYRMALQTREQHIRREKATSNICTAQALLAIMASMYAVYHGPKGLKDIANNIHQKTRFLNNQLKALGYHQINDCFFDTLCIEMPTGLSTDSLKRLAENQEINLRYINDHKCTISIDESCTENDLINLLKVFAEFVGAKGVEKVELANDLQIPASLKRSSEFLTHPVFNSHHSETKMMRYIKQLESKDLSLVHSMIPLGSCTMKLNAATQLYPISLPHFANIHPFAPLEQTKGYQKVFKHLSDQLCEITGFDACSLQPNSGAQGEYAGLLCIRNYHLANGNSERNIALIPSSAHGTNPASAVMAGMKVVVVKCNERGDIDLEDLKAKAEKHQNELSALMITYPSTHGVFEEKVKEICELIHQYGGQVYMDGANMNAQVGLTNPAIIGADVCHLNLHKTFSIPHGGGGPGMGPICVAKHLAPHLPKHVFIGGKKGDAVSAAPWGSSSILLISYAYIQLLGSQGLQDATEMAILNANYLKSRLEKEYEVLYTAKNGRVAHELIIDIRPFKKSAGIDAEDVAKRLMDYGFHAPTMSWPVAGTIMIEPTESEDKEEIDRFCDAMLSIREEIAEIEQGITDPKNNVLVNSPHVLEEAVADEWAFPYSREKAIYPMPYLRVNKFWPSVNRVNNSHGDRNLVCTCPPLEAYES